MQGEDITVRAEVYERAHLSWFQSWLPIYQDKYKLMGNSQIMVIKIFWDWAIYWSVPCVLFTNKGFTDLKVLKELFATETSLGRKFANLNKRMQDLFIEWLPYENQVFTHRYIDPFDIEYLQEFQQGIETQYSTVDLLNKIAANIKILEQVAAEVFRLISNQAKGTPFDMKVNPYTMSLTETVDTSSELAIPLDSAIAENVKVMWFYNNMIQKSPNLF